MSNNSESNSSNKKTKRKSIPARTPEGRENQLINLAVNLAEEKLRNGTASSQIIALLLQWASTKNRLENEKIKSDLEVAKAKIKQMEMQESSQEIYEKAIEAFKSYTGQPVVEDDYNDEEDY